MKTKLTFEDYQKIFDALDEGTDYCLMNLSVTSGESWDYWNDKLKRTIELKNKINEQLKNMKRS